MNNKEYRKSVCTFSLRNVASCCFLDMPLRGWTSQCQSQPDDLLVPPACLLSLHGGLHDNASHYIRLYAS